MIYWVVSMLSTRVQGLKDAMLRSDLCDYGNTYIVKERITVGGTNNANKRNKSLTFKNHDPLLSCILKINTFKY